MCNLTKNEILKATKPGDIFEGTREKIKKQYRELAKKFHADTSSHDDDIMAKINTLYAEAEKILDDNEKMGITSTYLEKSNQKIFYALDTNSMFRLNYLLKERFELGMTYYANTCVIYEFDKQHKKYYNNAIKHMSSLLYINPDVEKSLKPCMPKIIRNFETKDGTFIIVIEKTIDVYPMKLFIKAMNDKVPEKHIAWIISRYMSILMFLKSNELVHNGLSIENCFICPDHHTILPLGGWWYATFINDKMIGTQKQIYDIMPIKIKTSKISSIETDNESIKHIGRILIKNVDVNKHIKEFLNSGSYHNTLEQFETWDGVLNKAFGQRKFIKLDIAHSDIYKN